MHIGAKSVLGGFLVGVVSVGAALAGVVISPFDDSGRDDKGSGLRAVVPAPPDSVPQDYVGKIVRGDVELSPEEIRPAATAAVKAPKEVELPSDVFLAGAARASLAPAPKEFGGKKWVTKDCTSVDPASFHIDQDHVVPPVDPGDPINTLDEIRSWPASSPNCIYLGGYGLGPVRPAKRLGHGGVWVRTVAISNGKQTFIYSIADTVGWFARYDETVCSDCGILDVRKRVAKNVGVDVGNVIVGSTHSHAAADTYGGWGGIPDWYRNQLRDAAVASAKQAIANLRPARIEVGEAQLRNRNNERRDTYHSNVDTAAPWVQIKEIAPDGVIATWATYAGHPTIVEDTILHADWPGATARRLEDRYGGVGLLFEGGLGNASVSEIGGEKDKDETIAEKTGIAIADDLIRSITTSGIQLKSNAMKAATIDITHPTQTNPGLTTLASVGLFDRELVPGTPGAGPPGTYYWSKKGELSSSGEDNDPEPAGETLRGCSSSGVTVKTTTGAHRIGEFVVAFAPGEIFSNIAEVVKEKVDQSAVTMVLGQTNDALGYIIQSFEYDTTAGVVTEYGTQTGEYEEVFSIDRCFGDHVLETLLEAAGSIQ